MITGPIFPSRTRRAEQDEPGVEALRLTGGDRVESVTWQLGVALGELIERRASQFEQREEHHGGRHQDESQDDALRLHPGAIPDHVDDEIDQDERHRDHERGVHHRLALHQLPNPEHPRDAANVDEPFAVDGSDEGLLDQFRIGRQADIVRQLRRAGDEEEKAPRLKHNEAERHAYAGKAKPRPPAKLRTKPRTKHRGPKGAEIDAEVIKRETGITAWIALRIELANDGGDVRLQEADSHNDQRQRYEENRFIKRTTTGHAHFIGASRHHAGHGSARGQAFDSDAAAFRRAIFVTLAIDDEPSLALVLATLGSELVGLALVGQGLRHRHLLDRHRQMPSHQKQSTKRDRFARAEIFVGHEAADQRQQINQRGISAVLPLRRPVIEQEMLGHVGDEDSAHAVIRETLPHLSEEQNVHALGVTAHLQENRDGSGEGDDNPHRGDDIPHQAFSPGAIERARNSSPVAST